MNEIRTRIAPSPTGDWHLGTARTALFTYLFARQSGGKFYLRVEDTDQNRLVEGSEARILETMQWLGLDIDPYNDQAYVKQSNHLARYQEVAEQLVHEGKAYYCFATAEELQAMRDEQSAAKLPPRYDNRWGYRDLSHDQAKQKVAAGAAYVVRFKMPTTGTITVKDSVHGTITVDAGTLDDHVLLKADGFPTYHLAHIVDDQDMKITHVIRGDEWLPSAPRHVAVINALGWELPTYVHLPVILGPDKGKLSKRHGAKPVLEYRDSGYLPEAVCNYLLFLGWSAGTDQEIFSRQAMIDAFSLDRLQPNPGMFNAQKLDWFNATYLQSFAHPHTDEDVRGQYTEVSGLSNLIARFWGVDSVWHHRLHEDSVKFDLVVAAVYQRMTTLADFGPLAAVFYDRPKDYEVTSLAARGQEVADAVTSLKSVFEILSAQGIIWSQITLKEILDGLVESKNVKVGHIYLPLRYALTGMAASPGALECLVILGRDESLKRIETCLNYLS